MSAARGITHPLGRVLSALLVAMLGGCSNMPNMPDMMASADWKGRPAVDAITQFGTPDRIDSLVDRQEVVLVFVEKTAHTSREALGTYTGPKDGRLVHIESYGDVTRHSQCEIHVAINRARQVSRAWTQGGYCWQVDIRPKNPG